MVVLTILPTGEVALMMSPTLTSVGGDGGCCARDVISRAAAKARRTKRGPGRARASPAMGRDPRQERWRGGTEQSITSARDRGCPFRANVSRADSSFLALARVNLASSSFFLSFFLKGCEYSCCSLRDKCGYRVHLSPPVWLCSLQFYSVVVFGPK